MCRHARWFALALGGGSLVVAATLHHPARGLEAARDSAGRAASGSRGIAAKVAAKAPAGAQASAAREDESLASAPIGRGMGGAHELFPNAFVSSRLVERTPDGGIRVIEILEGALRDELVRRERTTKGTNGHTTTREVAMVANQLMVKRPDGLAPDVFAGLLRSAGAVEQRAVGSGTLATFAAEPSDPLALEANTARVRQLLGPVVLSPNYIRKLPQ